MLETCQTGNKTVLNLLLMYLRGSGINMHPISTASILLDRQAKFITYFRSCLWYVVYAVLLSLSSRSQDNCDGTERPVLTI